LEAIDVISSDLGPQIQIGDGTSIHLYFHCDVAQSVKIGGGATVLKGGTVGRRSVVGANAVVMANVGEGGVVGAGSVVTKPVPPWSIVAGNPAKVIGIRGDQNGPPASAVLEPEGG